MVRVKPEPSTQGNQGASTSLLDINPYIQTSKTMHPKSQNLDPNSKINKSRFPVTDDNKIFRLRA